LTAALSGDASIVLTISHTMRSPTGRVALRAVRHRLSRVANLLAEVLINFRRGPVADPLSRLAGWFMHDSVQSVARVVEVDNGLQTLEVAIMPVRLHEIGARPHLDVATGGNLNFAVEFRRELEAPVKPE